VPLLLADARQPRPKQGHQQEAGIPGSGPAACCQPAGRAIQPRFLLSRQAAPVVQQQRAVKGAVGQPRRRLRCLSILGALLAVGPTFG
jgi:hypothetical protein